MNLKDKLYTKALKAILQNSKVNKRQQPSLNPLKSILILFEGTDDSDRNEVLDFAENLKKAGKTVKLLSYMDSKGELMDFGMAVYNNSSINWYGFPKDHIFKLLESKNFDFLLNLNIKNHGHLHALACFANAGFKLSLPTALPHNFTMIHNTKEKTKTGIIIKEMMNCLKKLSEK